MTEHEAMSPWKRFWERGGWWKAILVGAAYYLVYGIVLGWLVNTVIFPPGSAARGPAGGPLDYFITIGLPLLLASVLLFILAWAVGWLKEFFGKQGPRGRAWMWIAVFAVLLWNIFRFVGTDLGKAGVPMVLSYLFVGLFIGFAEEVTTRGFVVTLMRKAGHSEIAVALVSAGVFAALHFGNFFSGQALLNTVIQVFYTFFFGLCMYLALRVTGRLIVPILLHASTDPSIFLMSAYPGGNLFTFLGGLGNFVVIGLGAILLIVLIFSGGKDRAYTKEGLKAGDPKVA